jgi:hypothetical protein
MGKLQLARNYVLCVIWMCLHLPAVFAGRQFQTPVDIMDRGGFKP